MMETVKEQGQEKYAWNLGTVLHQEGIAGLAVFPTFVAHNRVVFPCYSSKAYDVERQIHVHLSL